MNIAYAMAFNDDTQYFTLWVVDLVNNRLGFFNLDMFDENPISLIKTLYNLLIKHFSNLQLKSTLWGLLRKSGIMQASLKKPILNMLELLRQQ